ncbi:hypothetical protein [Stappia stellulata]|uniref:hypothetical protein n=1 Tax=Stappia stellulata TaxID=71235 RepID=UPI00048C3F1F|nr:hypothetical protein [Stappia stellulata]
MQHDDVSSASVIALAATGAQSVERADALRAAWPEGPVPDLAEAEEIWSTTRTAPDALLLVAGKGPDPQVVARIERLRESIRAEGVDVPLVVATRAGTGADTGWRRLPDAFLPPETSPALLATRLRETIRQSVRMEEARLRRMTLGALPGETVAAPHRPGGLMVAGLGQQAGAALERAGLVANLTGVLAAETVCRRLQEAGSRALFIDMPTARALDVIERVSADPRHVSLPVMAMAETVEDIETLLAAGCNDVVRRDVAPEDLGVRLRALLAAGARRALSNAALRRFRAVYLEEETLLSRAAHDAYLGRLREALSRRGRVPLLMTLADLHPAPLRPAAANDDPLAPVVGDPVRSTLLAASREEDFVARVEELGDRIVLRDVQAAAGLTRRVGAILASTSFA